MSTTVNGYPFTIRRLSDDEGGGWLVTFPDLPGCMSDGATQAEAKANAGDALASFAASCAAHGDPMPEPGSGGVASGAFRLRLPRSLHARIIARAKAEGVSMNALVATIIAEGMGIRRAR